MNVMSRNRGKGKARSGIGGIYSSYSNKKEGFLLSLLMEMQIPDAVEYYK